MDATITRTMKVGGTRTGLELARARHALTTAGVDPDVSLTRMSSVTNEVWLTDDVVIRVNRRLDKRLRREAELAVHLPPEVRYPQVVTYGESSGFDFLVQQRKPGTVLARAWPSMLPTERRAAVQQISVMLRALHRTPTPPGLPPLDYLPQLCAVRNGRMAASPLLAAIDRARQLPHVDDELIVSLLAYVKATAAVLEPYATDTLVHGDLTFENVLWDGKEVTALIDFEFARGAPSDVDLDVLLRFSAFPYLHVADDYAAETTAADYVEVPYWMRDDYPELFDRPHGLDRLRLYSIGFDLQQLLSMPPSAPARELSEHHPLRRLGRTIAQRSYLDTFAHGEHF